RLVASLTPREFRKNGQNTVTAIERTRPSVSRYRPSYSRSSSPLRGYSALMRRYPGRKKRRMRAPITRAVAAMAPRTSSGNASSPAGVYLKVVRRTILGGKGLGGGIGHRLRAGMRTNRVATKPNARTLDD